MSARSSESLLFNRANLSCDGSTLYLQFSKQGDIKEIFELSSGIHPELLYKGSVGPVPQTILTRTSLIRGSKLIEFTGGNSLTVTDFENLKVTTSAPLIPEDERGISVTFNIYPKERKD
ncbi:hypothetical protein [Corynebacterium caspium]|uniref:hypothetical protein n=1 Tax=Corynebacterium caspium TaxID=234828 RepID=UPI0014614268|nr:hypothetical protein [Corynebacterium caspium]